MRLFWIFVGALLIAAIAYLAIGGRSAVPNATAPKPIAAANTAKPAPPATPKLESTTPPPAKAAPAVPAQPQSGAAPAVQPLAHEPATASAASPSNAPPQSTATEANVETKPELKTDVNAEIKPQTNSAASGPASPDSRPPAAPPAPTPVNTISSPAAPAASIAPTAATAATPAPAVAAAAADFVGPPAPPKADAGPTTGEKIGVFDVSPSKIVKNADGSMLVDDRFTIKGEGTAEKPYEITWELLTSVEQDFDPHSGKKRIPQRLAMLNDKYVSLSGWISFPLAVQQPKELLLMLNQWDGCCIGVPPTPYDAIEVTLNKVIVGEERFAVTGSLVGKFGVKPYVVGDWLVGLYLMDRGDLNPKGFSGGGS
ncbi:MAG: hypothetical protein JSR77_00320 [Planctomycetes bacterium]|nr:hypothetical protein [Planctomycetota bacterium]